jgi:hypothetical protein
MHHHTSDLLVLRRTSSLTNCTLLTADVFLLCTKQKRLYLIHDSHSPFHRKMYIRLLDQCHVCPISPPVLTLYLTNILFNYINNVNYIFVFLLQLS